MPAADRERRLNSPALLLRAEHVADIAARTARHVARMQAAADREDRRLLTFTIEAEVHLGAPGDAHRFTEALEQVPDLKVAWAATSGATNAGAVMFAPAGPGQTLVTLSLEDEPEGIIEKVGDKLNIIEKQAESDLEKFKAFIEDEGYATGSWRGSVNEGATVGAPGIHDAAASRGDDGKAGISAQAVIAGAAVAAAGVAAATTLSGSGDDEADTSEQPATGDVMAAGGTTTIDPGVASGVDEVDLRDTDVVTVTPTTTATTATTTAPSTTLPSPATDERGRTY